MELNNYLDLCELCEHYIEIKFHQMKIKRRRQKKKKLNKSCILKKL